MGRKKRARGRSANRLSSLSHRCWMLLTPRKKLVVFLTVVSLVPIVALVLTYREFSPSSLRSSSSSLSLSSSPSSNPTPSLLNTMSVKSTVDQKISNAHVVVFSKSASSPR